MIGGEPLKTVLVVALLAGLYILLTSAACCAQDIVYHKNGSITKRDPGLGSNFSLSLRRASAEIGLAMSLMGRGELERFMNDFRPS